MTPLTHVPTHQLPPMVDSDSIILGTRSINYSATGNNVYIPISLDLSYQARLVQGERRGYVEAYREKSFL